MSERLEIQSGIFQFVLRKASVHVDFFLFWW